MKDATEVSVIIPVRNDAERLSRCLQSLSRQSYPADRIQIIVCDNDSSDDINAVKDMYDHVTFTSTKRRGSASARNEALRVASGDIIAFTDADCVPAPDWVSSATEFFEKNPDADVIGGSIVVTPLIQGRPTAMERYDMLVNFRQKHYIERYQFAATANMIVRRSALESTGSFDEEVFSFYGGEDRDWGIRCAAAGCIIRYAPDVMVTHPAQRSPSRFMGKFADIVRAERLLRKKHGGICAAPRCGFDETRIGLIVKSRRELGTLSIAKLVGINLLEACVRTRVLLTTPFRR